MNISYDPSKSQRSAAGTQRTTPGVGGTMMKPQMPNQMSNQPRARASGPAQNQVQNQVQPQNAYKQPAQKQYQVQRQSRAGGPGLYTGGMDPQRAAPTQAPTQAPRLQIQPQDRQMLQGQMVTQPWYGQMMEWMRQAYPQGFLG